MTKVSNIMDKGFICVSPATGIGELARIMRNNGTDAIVVCENGKYRGIVNRDDIVSFIAANTNSINRKTVASVMNNGLPKISPGVDIIDAAKIMARREIRHMPVVQNGKLMGLLTIDDLLNESPALAVIVMTRHAQVKGRKEREPAGAM